MLLVAAAAAGGEIRGTVIVSAPDGGVEASPPQPIVVYLTGFRQPPLPDAPVISQKDKTFIPDVKVIVAGQSVQFTNDDPFVHNVFSTSTARPFDLGQPGPHETRTVSFPNPGLAEIEGACRRGGEDVVHDGSSFVNCTDWPATITFTSGMKVLSFWLITGASGSGAAGSR